VVIVEGKVINKHVYDDGPIFNAIVEEFFANYKDNGMDKWGGFHLSEHTAAMDDENLGGEISAKLWAQATQKTSRH
jgi:hypothetical protein